MSQNSHVVGKLRVEWGRFNKTTVRHHVYFAGRFANIPAIVVSPEWPNSGVGHAETIHDTSRDGFGVHSGNRAGNYYVNWIAIGFDD